MQASQIIEEPVLRRINPFTKAYLLLFLILFPAVFGSPLVLVGVTSLVIAVILIAKIPVQIMLSGIRIYLILTFPVLFGLSWIQGPSLEAALLTSSTVYLRLLTVILSGSIFVVTTSAFDLLLPAFRHRLLRSLGYAVAAGMSSLLVFDKNLGSVVSLQRMRGLNFSWNPTKWRNTMRALQASLIPIILQAIDMSENFNIAMIVRGYGSSNKVTLPPKTKFRPGDLTVIIVASVLTAYVLVAGV